MHEKGEGSPRKNNLNVSLYLNELYKCVLTHDTRVIHTIEWIYTFDK